MDRYRVLIVDDHPDVRHMLLAWMQTLGAQYEVMAMPSGEEAMLVASSLPVDLLISDFRLPGINGVELFAKIKRRYPDLKVILITGVTDPKIRRQVAEAGADAFFFKPIQMPDFLDTVERTLGVVETFLPLAPIVEESEPPTKSLSTTLADLRQASHALAALLLDDRGVVQASAGNIPEENTESNLIPALTTAHHAGLKVSYELGIKTAHNLMFFTGRHYHICISPAGAAHVIVLVLAASEQDVLPMAAIGALMHAAQEIMESVSRVSITPPGTTEEEPLATSQAGFPVEPVETILLPQEEELQPQPVDIPDLTNLFKKDQNILDSQTIDHFWDAAVKQNGVNSAGSASALSYEEARRLGLAPKDEAPK
jgi:CheY-like chemotaxis protein